YDGAKPSWPLHLKGADVFGGQQVGGIARIELTGLPEPPEGWTLEMLGEVGDVITQSEFEDGLACTGSGHYVEWTDGSGVTWSGVPLWVLLGAVDDIELADHWTFSNDVSATNYSITVIAGDGYSRTFYSDDVARNDDLFVANLKNGTELSESDGYPLKLNGPAITSGRDRIGNIARIEIPDLQTPPAEPDSWNLNLSGKITDVIPQAEFEEGLACPASGHMVNWTQEIMDNGTVIETHEWSGIPLWFLAGWVDDRQPHEFSVTQSVAGYTITVKAGDGYSKEFASADVAWSDDYIVANMVDGVPLDDSWPLRLVGNAVSRANGALSGSSVGNIVEIKLTEFGEPTEIPELHIVKYAADRTTIVNETWIDYLEMQDQFDVIGDGDTVYKFQGITMDPEDLWSCGDDTVGGFKISNAIKGTRVVDLVGLVGGMGEGTDIVFVADDGYQTTLPYSSIYTAPEIQERQGDAVLAWYADGDYVPHYDDGMRLFFTPEDTIYGQCDMKETLPEEYWHYYYQTYSPSDPDYGQYAPGILYPSCAGLSAKYVVEIRVYSEPVTTWYLDLDGTRVGGITANISKSYFESALACQFGANHEVTYDDGTSVWKGMPLWFLAGFVDDADQHSDEAYNESLAMAGYEIVIIGGGDYTRVFDSVPTVRSNDYLVANTKNGAPIPESDTKNWPLKLVGEGVASSGKLQVGGIHTIILNFRPNITAVDAPETAMVDDEVTVTAYFTDPYDTHNAVFDWGGNQSTTGMVDEEMGMATGSHTYAMAGTYTVNVTVTDSVGASDTKSVTITVESPPESPYEMTEALQEYIMEDGLPHGTENALLSKLSAAMKFMGDGMMEERALDSGGNDAYKPKTAINILKAFIHYVEAQDGKKIPHETAMYLIGEVEEIIALLMEDVDSGAPLMTQSQSGTAAGNTPASENGNDNSSGPQGNSGGKKDDAAPSNSNAPSEPGSNGKHLGQEDSDADETPAVGSSNSEEDAPGSKGKHLGQDKVKVNNGKEK
ncbi:MAG: PKD domain-containing protein, partial [Methanomicrobiaceae archaeon]|nr:PKD domain-containing protein [Methanomicrobiaceae archaeon]